MLSGTTNIALSQYKNVDEKHIFFVQRWYEMLEGRTIDMYRYNILNTCVACAELADVIDKTMSGLLTSRQNVDDCKEEAFEIVKADTILEKHNRPLRNMLLRILTSRIDSKQRGDVLDDKNGAFYISLNRLKYQLKTPVRELENLYLGYIMQELEESINNQVLDKIEYNMGVLISQCISKGWSAKGLFLLATYFEGEDTAEEKWNEFKNKLISPALDSIEIYYSIKIETRPGLTSENVRNVIRSLGLQVKKGSEIINDEANKQNLFSKLKAQTSYIVINQQATDMHACVLSVINSLNNKLNVATFYNAIDPWIANSPQIIAYNCATHVAETLQLKDIFKTFDYIDSRNGVFEDSYHIFSDADKAHVMNKLSAAFAYTNLSRTSVFQENKYISLWIALESVMRTGQYSDIISHVKCVLPEIMCIRYIYRVVRNFSEDCIRCGIPNDSALSINMQLLNKKALVQQLISIFRDPQNYAILYARCEKSMLLQYRCAEIHRLLNDREAIRTKFEHYTRKIRRHIQRLYRIRNEITHSAFREDKSLVIYIEHMYSYLAQLVSEVVYYIEHKNVESVEEAFAILLENYNTYMELLKENAMPIKEVLPIGIVEL